MLRITIGASGARQPVDISVKSKLIAIQQDTCVAQMHSHISREEKKRKMREKKEPLYTMVVNFIYEYKILYKRSTQLLIK